MTILEKSRDLTVMELYKLTQDPMTETLKDHIRNLGEAKSTNLFLVEG